MKQENSDPQHTLRILFLVALFVGSIGSYSTSAQPLPDRLTMEQNQKLDQYILDYVRVLRHEESRPQPPSVEEFNEKYSEECRKRAEIEYSKHGRWFYCEDKMEFADHIHWDEVVTYRVYWQLIARYGSLEKIPNYSEENHRKALSFWQKWQRKDGSWFNAITGKGGADQCNGKYVGIILNLLGGAPLFETSGYGAAELNLDQCLKQIADLKMNHGTATLSVMLKRIDEGQHKYIPVFERAIELAVARISLHSGMFHGAQGQGGNWSAYGTTAETMKGMLRLIGYMGVENIPYRHIRADKLIEHQKQMRKGPLSVKRNTAEMMVQCLLESPYRREDLLKALNGHSEVILEGEPWESHITGDYAAYILMMFGPYLNWEGYDGRVPRTPFPSGAQYDYRVVVGPYGRCVNVIRKHDEELLWDKNWSYDKYGLRSRNTTHEKRMVVDVIPASAEGWVRTKDNDNCILLTRMFYLEETNLENPYVKIKWSKGDIEILLNGSLIKKKIVGMDDFGAVHIPEKTRKMLQVGKNTITVRAAPGVDDIQVSAGLIDWRLPVGLQD